MDATAIFAGTGRSAVFCSRRPAPLKGKIRGNRGEVSQIGAGAVASPRRRCALNPSIVRTGGSSAALSPCTRGFWTLRSWPSWFFFHAGGEAPVWHVTIALFPFCLAATQVKETREDLRGCPCALPRGNDQRDAGGNLCASRCFFWIIRMEYPTITELRQRQTPDMVPYIGAVMAWAAGLCPCLWRSGKRSGSSC